LAVFWKVPTWPFVGVPDPAIGDHSLDVQGGQQAAVDLAEEGARPGGIVAVLQDDHHRSVSLRNGFVQV
jgi:hypothetical protein